MAWATTGHCHGRLDVLPLPVAAPLRLLTSLVGLAPTTPPMPYIHPPPPARPRPRHSPHMCPRPALHLPLPTPGHPRPTPPHPLPLRHPSKRHQPSPPAAAATGCCAVLRGSALDYQYAPRPCRPGSGMRSSSDTEVRCVGAACWTGGRWGDAGRGRRSRGGGTAHAAEVVGRGPEEVTSPGVGLHEFRSRNPEQGATLSAYSSKGKGRLGRGSGADAR